jgi:hypothetical protein
LKNQASGPAAKKGQFVSPFVTVREGETVSDYRVSKIEPKSISLEKDGQTFTVSLFAENKVLSPAAPPPANTQPQPAAPAPGAAPQDGDTDQPQDAQAQPGVNPQNPQNPRQAAPMRAPSPNAGAMRNRNQAANANVQQNPQDPASEQGMQDQNQPAETIEEE